MDWMALTLTLNDLSVTSYDLGVIRMWPCRDLHMTSGTSSEESVCQRSMHILGFLSVSYQCLSRSPFAVIPTETPPKGLKNIFYHYISIIFIIVLYYQINIIISLFHNTVEPRLLGHGLFKIPVNSRWLRSPLFYILILKNHINLEINQKFRVLRVNEVLLYINNLHCDKCDLEMCCSITKKNRKVNDRFTVGGKL